MFQTNYKIIKPFPYKTKINNDASMDFIYNRYKVNNKKKIYLYLFNPPLNRS